MSCESFRKQWTTRRRVSSHNCQWFSLLPHFCASASLLQVILPICIFHSLFPMSHLLLPTRFLCLLCFFPTYPLHHSSCHVIRFSWTYLTFHAPYRSAFSLWLVIGSEYHATNQFCSCRPFGTKITWSIPFSTAFFKILRWPFLPTFFQHILTLTMTTIPHHITYLLLFWSSFLMNLS